MPKKLKEISRPDPAALLDVIKDIKVPCKRLDAILFHVQNHNGISARWVANHTMMSESYICKLRNGKFPVTERSAANIAVLFGLKINDIYGYNATKQADVSFMKIITLTARNDVLRAALIIACQHITDADTLSIIEKTLETDRNLSNDQQP